MSKPNCYECKHRRDLPGDRHSSCAHPSAPQSDIGALFGILLSARKVPMAQEPSEMKVTGNPHGIRSGWFNWPYNFDPVWLESCTGFEAAKKEVST